MTYTILCKVHVCGENVRPSTVLRGVSEAIDRIPCPYQSFAKEILLQRALSTHIVLKCDVSVGTKGTGKYSDVTENRFPGRKT